MFSRFYKLTVFSMCNVFSFARTFGENGRTFGQNGRKMADDQLLFIALLCSVPPLILIVQALQEIPRRTLFKLPGNTLGGHVTLTTPSLARLMGGTVSVRAVLVQMTLSEWRFV